MRSVILSALILAAPAISNARNTIQEVKCKCPGKEIFPVGRMCGDKEYQGTPEWFKDVKKFENKCQTYGNECFAVVGN